MSTTRLGLEGLPGTVMDHSVRIQAHRRSRGLRRGESAEGAWAELEDAEPELPDPLSDWAQEA